MGTSDSDGSWFMGTSELGVDPNAGGGAKEGCAKLKDGSNAGGAKLEGVEKSGGGTKLEGVEKSGGGAKEDCVKLGGGINVLELGDADIACGTNSLYLMSILLLVVLMKKKGGGAIKCFLRFFVGLFVFLEKKKNDEKVVGFGYSFPFQHRKMKNRGQKAQFSLNSI